MRVLLDECLPRKLAAKLEGHTTKTVPQAGWASIKNGSLLALAENEFDVFITVDRNLPYQQNLARLSLAIVVLDAPSNRLRDLSPHVPALLAALSTISPGEVIEIRA